MNCFVHDRSAAVGLCSVCQKALCRACVGSDTPRLVCRTCTQQRASCHRIAGERKRFSGGERHVKIVEPVSGDKSISANSDSRSDSDL